MQGTEINRIFEREFHRKFDGTRNLFILLGLLGDFDSFEYIQFLLPYFEKLEKKSINLFILGIGDEESKRIFCNYTKLPMNYLNVIEHNRLHNELGLHSGFNVSNNPYINLLLMCMGINSPGTLKEVLRGYTGDNSAEQIFHKGQQLDFAKGISFNAGLFDLLGQSGYQRPFELATLRLMNMIQVISSWQVYMMNITYLTQRGGTFLIDSDEKILFSYINKGLLGFSENMARPFDYLANLL